MSSAYISKIRKSYLFFVLVAVYVMVLYVAVSAFAGNGPSFIPGAPVPLIADPTISSYRVAPKSWGFRPLALTSTINVNFVPNGNTNAFGDPCITWPAGAQAAFIYTTSIWEPYLNSPVPIVIQACWTSLSAGVLAHGGSINFEYDFAGAPETNTLYPVALANALNGSDMEPASDDISVAFNNSFSPTLSWYFGTDGNPPVNSYDFVSVVLHEICHGLGFLGTMNVSGGTGSWGWSGLPPTAYDLFAVNGSGASLLNTALFPNPSPALAAQLTSNNIFFNGPNAVAANGAAPAKLYAPATWSPGSSYAHLDESFNGTPNALMTYSLSNRESVHDPGPVTLNILRDIGWTISGACFYSLGSLSESFDLNGGDTGSVSVMTSAGCGWTAVSNDPSWLTVTGGSSGSGNGTADYSVSSYTGFGSRTGTMTIAGETFTVTQTGCSYTLTPDHQDFAATGGTTTFAVSTNGESCPWSTWETLSWAKVNSGGGPGSGTVNYTVDPNGLIASRSGNINIADKSFVITQTGVLPVANFSVDPPGGTAPFQVVFTDLSINSPTSWSWSFGDGGTNTLESPWHTYKAADTYTVSLTATNANGFDTMTKYITVAVCGNPPVRVSGILDNAVTTIQAAYDSVSVGVTAPIDIQAIDFAGSPLLSLLFGEEKVVTLSGGFTCDYSQPRIPETLVKGVITISKGTVIFDGISIR